MAVVETVKSEAQPESQDKAKRERSDDSVPLSGFRATAIKDCKGRAYSRWNQAAKLGSAGSASWPHCYVAVPFQQRLNTARIFGLLTNSKGMITLTAAGNPDR